MDAATVARLTSGEGRGLLESLPPYDESQAMIVGQRLRVAGFDAELVAAALTQSRLRAQGVAKLGPWAERMLLTQDGLEQATRRSVAERHAQRLLAAGAEHVHDLGCGIGADAMAFADAGLQVQALDLDPGTAAVAAANLRPWPTARVEVGSAAEWTPPPSAARRGQAVWFDPARRTPGVADAQGRTRRVFSLERISPPWDVVRGLAEQLPAAGAKLAPALGHHQVPPGSEAVWTSVDHEVVECAVWWGDAVVSPGRAAEVLRGGVATRVDETDAAEADPTCADLARLGPWLYEPDKAVLRAGLVGALVRATGGRELAAGVGYVSSDHETTLPWARRLAVQEAMPYHLKSLRARLRDLDAGRVTIKKRGSTVDPDQLRRQLRLKGFREITILLTRVGSAQVVLLVTPV